MPEETYARLESFLRNLFRVLDEAATLSVRDFDRRKHPIDDYHLASGVRSEARWRLQELKGTEFECALEDLKNNGLQILYRRYALRVRKAEDGQPPAPTQSKSYSLYYHQASLFPEHRTIENLLVLWTFDYSTRSIGSLYLSKPEHWKMEIPHPLESILPTAPPEAEVFEDLEIPAADEYADEGEEAEDEEL